MLNSVPNPNEKWYRKYCPISGPMFARICKDYWLILSLGAALSISFHWLFVTFLPMYNMRYRLQLVRRAAPILKAMIGEDINDIISTTSLGAFAYLHPISLAILIGFGILLPTGLIVGPIDRGTIELVLATPLSRKKYMATTIVAGLLGGLILTGAMLMGSWIGILRTQQELPQPYHLSRIIMVVVNLFSIYVLVLGVSAFLSAISSIRGWVVGWAFGLTLVAYLLHFLAEWWEWVRTISFVGPMYYYHPIKIAVGKYDPTRDIVVIAAAGVIFLILSVIAFCRRNIAVV